MGSLGGEAAKKAMWLYPKLIGFSPTERWGHSACYSDGFIYVFGGCCGGLHFSDVIMLNLDTMVWSTLVTTGQGPGPRDSHSAVLVEQRMIVFGGTNGSKKSNDLHILDLRSQEWTKPNCKGVPPSPRESHTATLVGDEKLVIFGGSGEGEANYLNDLYVLDLKTMRWSYPEVRGNGPLPRDSHSAVAIGGKIFVYGGDCGDRYEGDIDVFDIETMTWSRFLVQGPSPGVRAGHAAVNIGSKVYVIAGVGEKQYYNDVWILDVNSCLWSHLEIGGQKPQGRFSHTAVATETDIAIFGGCGEDEHPVNDLIVLQLGGEHPKGRYNVSLCKIFGKHCSQEKRRLSRVARTNSRTVLGSNGEAVRKEAQDLELESKRFQINSDTSKRKRMSNTKTWETESEPEEHSLSLSQHSSPSQSDQEQTPVKRVARSVVASQVFPLFKHCSQIPSNSHSDNVLGNQTDQKKSVQKSLQDFNFLTRQPNQPDSEQHLHIVHMSRHEGQYSVIEPQPLEAGPFQNLVGADVRGKIDGLFDSGYLMTAIVNGKIFRGVLFSPGPEVASRSGILGPNHSSTSQRASVAQRCSLVNHASPFTRHPQEATAHSVTESCRSLQQGHSTQPSIGARGTSSVGRELPKLKSDLQGVVLTLGGLGNDNGES